MIAASYIFSLVALIGFIASLIAHLAGYAGIDHPLGLDPWPLHVGIFVVWLPAVLAAQKLSKDFPQKDMWKATLRGCPKWMRYTLFGLFGYAFLSFFAFFLTVGKSHDEANTIRGFSGHWLIFYFAAFAILQSYARVSANDTVRRCKNQHVVEPSNEYCPKCGEHVGKVY
jgi:rRNA maturation protein Nop10